jgi:hypothetical protein
VTLHKRLIAVAAYTLAWIAVLVSLAYHGRAHADEWRREDTYRELAVAAVLTMDAVQTAQYRHRDDIEEGTALTRSLIGKEPTGRDTALYFGTLAISHYLIARALPAKWRPYWQGGVIAYEGYLVIRNCSEYDVCP